MYRVSHNIEDIGHAETIDVPARSYGESRRVVL